MKSYPRILTLCLLLAAACSGCYYDKEDQLYPNQTRTETDTVTVVTYSGTIRTLVAGSCATTTACHAAGSPYTDLSAYAGVSARKTDIKRRINLAPSDPDHMPQGSSLPASDLAHFNTWLDAGALNN